MTELTSPPQVWSDFDGTAVELIKPHNPRNWLKYPVSLMPGYPDFLRGMQSEGVRVAGIISRRPELRRWVTSRSIGELGLDEFFGDPNQIILSGSNRKKGRFIAEISQQTKVALLEDKPYRVGVSILRGLFSFGEESDAINSVAIGVVPSPEALDDVGLLGAVANSLGRVSLTLEADNTLSIAGDSFKLGLIYLPQYSEDAGKQFAQRILTE